MKKYILFFFLPVLLIGLHACDEGRIYENAVVATGEGRTVKMTGRISGVDKWSGDYSVVVAGFDDESDYAIIITAVHHRQSSCQSKTAYQMRLSSENGLYANPS